MTIVQERGWLQGGYTDGRRVCADMAIQIASEESPWEVKVFNYFRAAVCTKGILPVWNDALTTTYEDVILGFKRAAELAERAGE